jgi:hypothetical protein
LKLEARQKQRAEAQLNSIETELAGEPNLEIVRQAARSLRSITEGTIGSLLAASVQPSVWQWVQQFLAQFH